MPAGDRTGPMGQGPKTGRGAGFCTGGTEPGFNDAQPRMGSGRGRGRRGRGNGRGGQGRLGMEGTPATTSLPPTPDVNQELAELKQKTTTLEHTLSELKTLIMGLEKPTTEVSSNEPEEQK